MGIGDGGASPVLAKSGTERSRPRQIGDGQIGDGDGDWSPIIGACLAHADVALFVV